MKCSDCGTKIYNGLCSNCHEEAYIVETQSDYLADNLSNNFIEKVEKQRIIQKKNLKRMKAKPNTKTLIE